MSSEGDNVKNVSSETNDKSVTDTTDSSQDSQDLKDEKPMNDVKAEGDAKSKESTSAEPPEKPKNDVGKESKEEPEEKVNDVEEKRKDEKSKGDDTEEAEGSEKDEEDDEGSEKGDDKKKPLLDQPLEQSGTRERKKVQRFNEDHSSKEAKDSPKVEVPNGSGTPLGEIPRIDASISRFKNDDLRLLHRVLFRTPGKTTMIKKNIKKFNGFDFKKDSEEYSRKISAVQKFEVKQLKSVCEMLDLDKKGNKDEIVEKIVDFLLEPKDSGKPVSGGRPKRTAAVRANNRGYTSHDDYSSDEKQATRSLRDKGRRPNLKDESSSESDEDFHPSDASDERPRVNKRQSKRRKQQSDDEASDLEETASSEESDDEPKNKRKRSSVKVANNKAAKGKAPPGRRGRKPASGVAQKKPPPPKRGRKPAKESSEEDESEAHDDASSSEDEPLAKKAKNQPQPPTDEEIKTYVKEILEGANLEEITMKTVCKQVYAHYPDFDLSYKKDFIKTTVKSLIST